jgi:hypothetical protein
MGLQEIFETVSSFFDEKKVQYAVIGGFALYGFGYIRATQDIDFVIRIGDQKKVVQLME